MRNELKYKTVLGIFIFIGLTLLVSAIYVVGSKKNMFSSTMKLAVLFHEVNGLQGGNNVRFRGIDVGTIQSVLIENDSTIKVNLIIDKSAGIHIKKNAIASIGTDGLMGNKILNIHNQNYSTERVKEYDILKSMEPIAMEEVYRTLNNTNENIRIVTEDLKTITKRISSGNNIWNLLSDNAIAENLKITVSNIKYVSRNTKETSANVNNIIRDIKTGKTSLGSMILDSSMRNNLNASLQNILLMSDSVSLVIDDIKNISGKIKKGEGAIGTMFSDTSFANKLNASMNSIEKGTSKFNESMDALKQSVFFRKYFKKRKP